MEHVRCNLCGADNAEFVLYAKNRSKNVGEDLFKLVKCSECGLTYLDPRPDKEEIKKYYIGYHSRSDSKFANIEQTEIWGIPWREAMRRKAVPILKYKKTGKILDIGCGDGSLLKYLKESGWQTYGVEFQETASLYARDVLGIDVFSGRLEDAKYSEESFDVITLIHVFEHLPDPSETLKKARSLLKKDGILLIEVPNFNSFEARIFRGKWVGLAAPLHLYQFTPRTLSIMLKRCGLFPVEVGTIPEQTKYISGYSESLRYFFQDLGLYPFRRKGRDLKKNEEKENTSGMSWMNGLHFLESRIFSFIAYLMNKIGLGSNLFVVARRED